MSTNSYSQFELSETFFIKLFFKRSPSLIDPITLPIITEIKIGENEFPRIQVVMRVFSGDNPNIDLELAMVAIFRYTGENHDQGRGMIIDFLNDKGIHMLYPAIAQMVRGTTSLMGMSPLNVQFPPSINLQDNIAIRPESNNEK